jgi:beta-lactamase superfamily II metal-dependent hydrolase
MIFSLDVRRARNGDCLLIHFGSKRKPGLIMIDGGPANVFGPHLEPRLDQIRQARKLAPQDALPVDLLMVSHVDDDHIRGLLDLTRDEIDRVSAQQALKLNVLDFWHNSFDEIIASSPAALTEMFERHFGEAASSFRVLASIPQGFRLRQDAARLGYPLNSDFDGKLVAAHRKAKKVTVAKKVKLTIVGPMRSELEALHEKHQEWLRELQAEGRSPSAALAAYLDASVSNLSSIVVLAELNKKRMLLTGDARGDKILEGLELVGVLKPGKKLTVDILKVPHHGSARNLDRDFFARVLAKHYVFSGDGEHGNPERASLEMLFGARGTSPFTVHLTYPVKDIDAKRKHDWEEQRAKEKARKATRPSTKVRAAWSAKKQGLVSFFRETPLANGQKVRIVDDGKAHVIDLLDPVGF